MTEQIQTSNPLDTAKQLLAFEALFGSLDFLPADRKALPELKIEIPQAALNEPKAFQQNVAAAVESIPDNLTPQQKADMLGALDQEVKACTLCSLSKTRTNTVFGEHNPSAKLVIIGEAPGADEDASGRPFVGRAGALLTKMLGAMGLSREDIFICNILKCRPPENRNPSPSETQCCWNYLVRQLQIIRPQCIVTLGNPATMGLLNTKIGITKLRGQWQVLPELAPGLKDIPVMPTFHPAYVLRNYSVETRRRVWSDLQQVMKLLGLGLPSENKK